MLIIDKDDFDIYRYAVAKIVFLRLYADEYSLIKNIPNSNCFILEQTSGEKILASLFREPEGPTEQFQNLQIIVFYQKRAYTLKNRTKNFEKDIQRKLFKETFDNLFNSSISNVLIHPWQFINENQEHYKLLDELIINAKMFHDTSGSLYKYYSVDGVLKKPYGIIDGNLSFMNPCTFNDPFDCDCFTASNNNISNIFRVLCTIPCNDDILMWSYYGDNHKGYCFEYFKKDIIDKIINMPTHGICIIGKVDYKETRPNYKANVKTLSYSNLKFLIDCTFTKFKKWEHEQEYRFVIIDDTLPSEGELGKVLQINVPIINVFNGCKGDGKSITDKKGKSIQVTKLSKDPIDYSVK